MQSNSGNDSHDVVSLGASPPFVVGLTVGVRNAIVFKMLRGVQNVLSFLKKGTPVKLRDGPAAVTNASVNSHFMLF